jgi:hypothetical protein
VFKYSFKEFFMSLKQTFFAVSSVFCASSAFAIDGASLKVGCEVVGEGIKTSVVASQKYDDGCDGYGGCGKPFYFHSNGYSEDDFYGWKGAENEKSPRIWFTGLSNPTTEVDVEKSNFTITLYPSQSFYDSSDKLLNKAIEISNQQGLNAGVDFKSIASGSYTKEFKVPVLENEEVKTISAKLTCKILK